MTEKIWCLSGALSLRDAECFSKACGHMAEATGAFPPTISQFEIPNSQLWQMEAFYNGKPSDEELRKLLSDCQMTDWIYTLEIIENKDWVSESQKLLKPVHAGRFFVYGSHDRKNCPDHTTNLQIDAGQAFGTGSHETTTACLLLLDQLADQITPRTMLDLGTGTGLLALAAQTIWPNMHTLATDIDPIAIDVTCDNLVVNQAPKRAIGDKNSGIACAVADGFNHHCFKTESEFDLITANILASPLVAMAGDISQGLAKGGALILSGLLDTQENTVIKAYDAQGLQFHRAEAIGEWRALYFSKT